MWRVTPRREAAPCANCGALSPREKTAGTRVGLCPASEGVSLRGSIDSRCPLPAGSAADPPLSDCERRCYFDAVRTPAHDVAHRARSPLSQATHRTEIDDLSPDRRVLTGSAGSASFRRKCD